MVDPTDIRVVKIGGSLLEYRQAPDQIASWISRQPAMPTIWIAGGGRLVDVIRAWGNCHPLSQEVLHWLAVDLLDSTARLVSNWFPNWNLCETIPDNALRQRPHSNLILLPSAWVRQQAKLLPQNWTVTSDSIAAEIAGQIGASELVLLKSKSAPTHFPNSNLLADSETGTSSGESTGYVDDYFFSAIGSVPVRFVNLRDLDAQEVRFKK